MDGINETLSKRLVEKWLKPYRKKWKMRSYSAVIERIFVEWKWFTETYPELFAQIKKVARDIDEDK